MARMNLSSPWVIYYRELEEMFRYDPEVHVVYDDVRNIVKLFVDCPEKAEALDRLLIKEQVYGNVKLKIEVVPANNAPASVILPDDMSIADTFRVAFNLNGAFSFAAETAGVIFSNLTYIVFRKMVVQYFNDDLGDAYGQCSTLYQNIAQNIFVEREGVFYCTDKKEPIGFEKSEEVWP